MANKKSKFDERFGVDTSGIIALSDLDVDAENWVYGVQYQPTPAELLREMLGSLQVNFEDFIFIDFGSGKGRALLVASEFPFKEIVGIEFVPQLHQIAQENIHIYKSATQKCKNLKSICVDAAKYTIPNEQAIIYFYNPFEERLMEIVVANIQKTLMENPRKIFIIYYEPVLDHLFINIGIFRKIKHAKNYVIYIN